MSSNDSSVVVVMFETVVCLSDNAIDQGDCCYLAAATITVYHHVMMLLTIGFDGSSNVDLAFVAWFSSFLSLLPLLFSLSTSTDWWCCYYTIIIALGCFCFRL